MATNFSPTRAVPILDKSPSVARHSVPLWQCGLVFGFAFALHFNPAIGLGGQTAASQGFNGFRVIDVLSFGAVLILGAYSVPRRILPVAFYALIMGTLFAMPTLSNDQQTAVLAYHIPIRYFRVPAIFCAIRDCQVTLTMRVIRPPWRRRPELTLLSSDENSYQSL
jgi:hypothetical protein